MSYVNNNLWNCDGEKSKDKTKRWSSNKDYVSQNSFSFQLNLGIRKPFLFKRYLVILVVVWPHFFSGPWILKWLGNQKWSRKLVRVSWQHGYTTLLVWLHGLLCFLFQIDNLIWFDTIQIVRKKNSKLSGLSCVS